jgi:LVIVD repeat
MEERMHRKRWLIATIVAVFVAAMILAPSASASHKLVEQWAVGSSTFGGVAGDGNDDFYGGHHAQHGPSTGHLEGGSHNVDLVGKLRLTKVADDISDVSGLQAGDGTWYAYVGDWGAKCQSGGVHVVDISDPANPVKTGFLNSGGTGYVTEGLQALRINTEAFTGDILVVSNEWCQPKSNPKQMPGGITIWDITDPTNPERLVQAFGDFDLHGNRANESHSAIAWDAMTVVFSHAAPSRERPTSPCARTTRGRATPRSPTSRTRSAG